MDSKIKPGIYCAYTIVTFQNDPEAVMSCAHCRRNGHRVCEVNQLKIDAKGRGTMAVSGFWNSAENSCQGQDGFGMMWKGKFSQVSARTLQMEAGAYLFEINEGDDDELGDMTVQVNTVQQIFKVTPEINLCPWPEVIATAQPGDLKVSWYDGAVNGGNYAHALFRQIFDHDGNPISSTGASASASPVDAHDEEQELELTSPLVDDDPVMEEVDSTGHSETIEVENEAFNPRRPYGISGGF